MVVFARADPPPLLDLILRYKTLADTDQLHALITSGQLNDARVVLRLCSSPHPHLHLLARRTLSSRRKRKRRTGDVFLYNALIKSSSHGSNPHRAILTFSLMLSDGVVADAFSFSLALKACARLASVREGSQIHSLLAKVAFGSDLFLQNSLIGLYSKCGLYHHARRVFDRIPNRDSVSWNSMIDGYIRAGKMEDAQKLFNRMGDEDKNLITWNSMIGGYARSLDGIDVAQCLFDRSPDRDLVSWNLMLEGYAKSGRMADALEFFERMAEKDVIAWANMIAGYMEVGSVTLAQCLFIEMPTRDVIAWNIMMNGYAKNGFFAECLQLFNEMRDSGHMTPDCATLVIALSAISELGRTQDGISVHRYIERNRLPLDGKLGVALIDMYSNCGLLEHALQVFEVSRRTIDHWNAMIGGLAIHGFGELALELFTEMQRLRLKPDDITFIGVLNACSHTGLVEEGLMYLQTMVRDYKLTPKVQHYGCMVDILGRAGQLQEAWGLIKAMPMEPNDIVWRSLLSACRNHGNAEIGQKVADILIEMDSCNSSSYVLLSNIFAGCGMWGDASKVRMLMRERDLRKIPGCSWIELDGIVHEFVVGDKSHPQAKDIYSLLEILPICNLYSLQVS